MPTLEYMTRGLYSAPGSRAAARLAACASSLDFPTMNRSKVYLAFRTGRGNAAADGISDSESAGVFSDDSPMGW